MTFSVSGPMQSPSIWHGADGHEVALIVDLSLRVQVTSLVVTDQDADARTRNNMQHNADPHVWHGMGLEKNVTKEPSARVRLISELDPGYRCCAGGDTADA